MRDGITVKVVSYGPSRPLAMVYIDPVTGKKVAKSSGTRDERAADRAAAVWEDELNSGRYVAPSKLTWSDFRSRYEREKLATLAAGTRVAVAATFSHVEAIIAPDRLVKLTASVLSRFQAKLRDDGLRDTTIAIHLRHLKAALRWAVKHGLLAKCPEIEIPRPAKGARMMKGRPITLEEFERMTEAAAEVRPDDPGAWVRLLTGLWLSGLRLEEARGLSWDDGVPFSVDLTGRHPAFMIYAEAQKARRDEVLPMTPDFATWLLENTPEGERTGPVFPLPPRPSGVLLDRKEVVSIISKIGKTARVVVDKAAGKHATAHDLRRSFGTRWAKRVMPAVLKRLMRHADIQTTMSYYVDLDADEMADDLWARYSAPKSSPWEPGNTFGNNSPNPGKAR